VVPVGIQIIESNPHLRSLLAWHLQQAGYSVVQAADLHQARDLFLNRQPTLVVLDTELAEGQPLEFCQWLQGQQSAFILLLSVHHSEADIVAGLKAGADDFLAKPFGMQEFLARADALTRRSRRQVPPAVLHYGDLKIDVIQRRVCLKEELIDLTPQEFSLLYVLAQASGQPLSRSELLQRAWPDEIDNPRTVDTHVLSLRKKLEIDPKQPNLIQTIRNVGYRLNLEVLGSQTSGLTSIPPTPINHANGNKPGYLVESNLINGHRRPAWPSAALSSP
jgi:two-component system, OmpR family, response regulator